MTKSTFQVRVLKLFTISTLLIFWIGVTARNWAVPLTEKQWIYAIAISVGLFVLGVSLLRAKSHDLRMYLFAAICVALIFIGAILNGGIRAPVVAFTVLLPLIAVALLGIGWGGFVAFFCVGIIGTLFLMGHYETVVPFQLSTGPTHSLVLAIVYSCLVTLSFCYAAAFEICRRRMEQATLEVYRFRDLRTLAGGLSHEINNPLTAIRASMHLLEHQLKNSPQTQQMAKLLDRNIGRIEEIINSMALFAKNEVNESPVEVEIKNLIDHASSLCRERILAGNCQLDLADVDDDIKVKCFPAEIVRVLVGGLLNSFEAVSTSAEKWIRVSARKEAAAVNILVTDSGPGIQKHLRNHLFTPFTTSSEPGKGIGLTLAVAKNIIHLNGGKIYFQEDAPVTTLVIQLPRAN